MPSCVFSSVCPSHLIFSFSTLFTAAKDLYEGHQWVPMPLVLRLDWNIREPWQGIRSKNETEVSVFRSPPSFLQVILGLLCPSWKSFAFFRMAYISVTAYHPYFLRSWDSNSSFITRPGFCAYHSLWLPYHRTLIYSPFLNKLSSNYPNLSIPSVSCWVPYCSNYHQ